MLVGDWRPPIKVFISCAPEDRVFKTELLTHLAVLRRAGVIETWHDECVEAGEPAQQQIESRFCEADLLLILISADYLASDYHYNEFTRAFLRNGLGNVRAIFVHVRPVGGTLDLPQECGLLPSPPVSRWSDRDDAWRLVVREVEAKATGRQLHDDVAAAISKIRREFLMLSSRDETRRLLFELEALLANHPLNVDGRLLKRQLEVAIRPAESKSVFLADEQDEVMSLPLAKPDTVGRIGLRKFGCAMCVIAFVVLPLVLLGWSCTRSMRVDRATDVLGELVSELTGDRSGPAP